MNFELSIKISVFIILIGFFALRSRFITHYKKRNPNWAVKYIIAIIIVASYFFGLFDFALLPLSKTIRLGVGLSVIFLGLILFFWTHAHLRNNWSPVIEKKFAPSRKLITTGPYHFIRHPTYAASFITLLGFFLFTANWLLTTIPALILVAFYSYKVPREEKELIRNFGKKYVSYMHKTPRFIPRL